MSEKRTSRKNRRPLEKTAEVPPVRPADDPVALTSRQAGIILAIGLAFGLGVIYEVNPLNSFASLTKWGWPWQDLGTLQMGLALLAPFLVIAGVMWGVDRARVPVWLGLGAIIAANFCLQLFSTWADPRGLERITQIVKSPDATAYFVEASKIQNLASWMSNFHQASLTGHARFHPAGPVIFYYAFQKLFGPDTGAFLGGCTVGLIASLGAAVMYWFAGLWTSDRSVRFTASAFYALLPALTVFFPEFDQAYPIFSMTIIFTFVTALNRARKWWIYALAMGATVFLATFFAYNLLTMGAFPVYYGLYWLWRERGSRAAVVNLLRTAGLALTVGAGLYFLLWWTTGYNAPGALRHSLRAMEGGAEALGRYYRISIFADLYDFFLGTGIIAVPILWFHLRKLRTEFKAGRDRTALTLISLATVLTVDLTGLLPGETARVWLFLQPLVVVPVAIELARARWRWRISILTVQWWILVLIKAKMSFIEP